MNTRCYTALKESQLRVLLRESKVGQSRRARVLFLFLSGVRHAESRRRANRPAIDLRGTAAVFVNPLISWTDLDMLRHTRRYRIPESDAAALMHRSNRSTDVSPQAPGLLCESCDSRRAQPSSGELDKRVA